jgi:asparagine synthase (glutamine-hydrolysing)
VLADVVDRGLVEQALYLDTHLFLPDGLLICADKMSMSASLEQRVPFLDVELMRFVEATPARERVRIRDGKRLHRKALARLVPPAVVERPKHGFSTPYGDWMRTSLGDEVRRRCEPGNEMAELVDPATVDQLVAANAAGAADHKLLLYCLLELSQWHRTFIQGEAPVPS